MFFTQVGQQLPIRLEPRSSETVVFPNFVTEVKDPRIAKATHIIARTACGYTKKCKFNPSFYLSD